MKIRWLITCLVLLSVTPFYAAHATGELVAKIYYIEETIDRPPNRSSLIQWPDDDGLAGALLAIDDNNTTGKFLKQRFELQPTIVASDNNVVDIVKPILASGAVLMVLNVSETNLLAIADLPDAHDDLLFNARNTNNSLRSESCRSNVLHTMASRKMQTDGLMQFLSKRRWSNLFLIEGARPGDSQLAESMRQSINKFGLKVVQDKQWLVDADIRRNASLEVPVYTQHKKYDAIVVADEDRDFGQYLLYNTWLARPVTGSAGLRPVVWDAVVEQWGALQLHSRFDKLASRKMTGVDYANWAAIRSIGEAVTRTKSVEPAAIRQYVLSDAFSLAGFKGHSLSFRLWNGQLRQPIPLVHAHAVVATAPLEGFLHKRTELDTLGLDEPESQCSAF